MDPTPCPARTERPDIADVLVPVAVDTAYSYRIPAGLDLVEGDTVVVPLGTRQSIGVVWSLRQGPGGANLKQVAGRYDLPPMRPAMRAFVEWIARWTLSPRGMVARMALRDPDQVGPERPKLGVRFTGLHPERMTPARRRVLTAAENGMVWRKSALAEAASVSSGVIDTLVDEGALEVTHIPADPVAPLPDADHAAMALSQDQADAAANLGAMVQSGAFAVALIEGVTGSGKTEVYFEAIAAALRLGRQALVLMPEIALTADFMARFEARFGVRPAEWHSGVSASRRDRLWHAVATGQARIVVGARSALMLPFADLGLIVVDEEHEAAYKQGDGVRYNARDMAVVRGRIEGAAVVLASATPSVESRVNAESGRYRHLRLPDRFGGAILPELAAIDLRKSPLPPGRWIAAPLLEAARTTLAAGEQVLFFLNRRGFAPLTLCNRCGHRWQCPHCSAWLVEHRFRRALVCHHCGHTERRPPTCVSCGAENELRAVGPGVERLAEEVAELFPGERSIVLSSDFPGGTERLRQELAAIAAGEYRIVIGTQLVAKGHNFPSLTLAGVIDADIGLANADPRAAERTFQMLTQVTGRTGRHQRPGRGLIQTTQPDHPVLRAILTHDREGFYREEIRMRQLGGLPPFGRLAALMVSARDRAVADEAARRLAQAGLALSAEPRFASARLLGPAEPPLALLRGRHRMRLIIKTARGDDLQGFLRAMIANAGPMRSGARLDVDVEPLSFL
ncbi:MAG TPA: primosomal protein N' [Beijerinckiaceae bacterium]|nr:primosomal protein N' [Beijerinckiaceae bacterium]